MLRQSPARSFVRSFAPVMSVWWVGGNIVCVRRVFFTHFVESSFLRLQVIFPRGTATCKQRLLSTAAISILVTNTSYHREFSEAISLPYPFETVPCSGHPQHTVRRELRFDISSILPDSVLLRTRTAAAYQPLTPITR